MSHHFLAAGIKAFLHPFASTFGRLITSLDFLRHLGLRLSLIRHRDMQYLSRQFSYSYDLDSRLQSQQVMRMILYLLLRSLMLILSA